MKEVVSLDAAIEEIENWLDWRKIMPSARSSYQANIDILIEAVQYGLISITDNAFTQKLQFPIGADSAKVESLTYKPRLNNVMLEPYLKGIKAGESTAIVTAYLACLTAAPKQILKSLDSVDSRIADSIVVFFM